MLMRWLLDYTYEWGLIARTTSHVITELELFSPMSPNPHLQGEESAWKLNPLSLANDLINNASVMKPP